MTRTSCFGDLGGVKSCWGYKLKIVIRKDEIDLKNNALFQNVRVFSMKELQKATNNFSTKLSQGGFASYYKGTLENGTLVMIKAVLHGNMGVDRKKDSDLISKFTTLSRIRHRNLVLHGNMGVDRKKDSDLISKFTTLSRIRHRNLVEFVGCCVENDRMLMVYEFVGDYSLEQLMFGGNSEAKQSELDWSTRASICIGIARGLEYLHEGSNHSVVHRDIKPNNIVLDSNFNPKIVDFGLTQLYDDTDSFQYSTAFSGTNGYMDPEYYRVGRYTVKSDVYAFGMILLEVISGRKVSEFLADGNGVTLVGWVWELRETDRIHEIVDPTLSDFPEDEVNRYVEVALMCVQSSSNLRPTMSEALLMLLGPCDISKKQLRNPEKSVWSNYRDEVDSLNLGKDPRNTEITYGSSDHLFSPIPAFGEYEALSLPSQPAIGSMSKRPRDFETEIESDLQSNSSASELLEISHDLETDLCTSVEENISTLTSVSGPSDKNKLKPEYANPSYASTSIGNPSILSADIRVQQEAIEAAEQTSLSHDLEDEIQMTEPSQSEFLCGLPAVEADVKITSSAEIDSSIQNESVDKNLLQAENSNTTEVLSLPKIYINRPIHHTLEKILEAFKDAHHRRICLYGRRGSGKTTVLKNLFYHPATKELFDQVLFVTVPRFAYKKHLQHEIVQQLLLDIEESCSEDEIICLIHQALMDRKLLVLLDNVSESINLQEVGIPNPSPENGCWLVSATSSLDVCHLLADKEIEMEVLSNVEALEFFCCQVQDVIDSPEIEPYAKAISKECYGSPVIISAIGSALRGETSVEEWELALKTLRYADTVNIDGQYHFTRHIKYCYDRLKAHDVKTCFLYTALFQEDADIDITTLVESFIGEGLVSGTPAASYNKGHDIVRRLTNASLLEATDNGLKVKMHNLVRDSALEILSSDVEGYQAFMGLPNSEKDEDKSNTFNIQLHTAHKYLTRAGAHLKESPPMEEWEQATMIFLMDNQLSNLPSKPNCSTLVALLLQRNNCLRVIPASFFDSMSTLKILNLSKTRIKSLPDSFSKLSSLEILLLRDCERLLLLPPSIGLLKSLEVLDLQGTEVTHLPDSVGQLASLKQLSVSFYGSMNRSEHKKLPSKLVSDGIILSLGLRELGIFVYPGDQRWKSNASSITKEISNLRLSVLYFHFPKIEDLEYFVHKSSSWKNRNLTTFSMVVGHDFKRSVSLVTDDTEALFNKGQRRVRFVNGDNIPDSVVELLVRATSFYLDHHLTISNLSQFGIRSFDGLKSCVLRDCPELLGIVSGEEHGGFLFPFLENLSINNLWKLEKIWFGHIAMGNFARLRCLSVHSCPKLRYIFTCSMLDILFNLEDLVIEDCVSLEYVVIGDDDVKRIMCGDTDVGFLSNKTGLPTLRSLKVLKLHYLPKLCGIWRGRWPLLECMSFYNCPRLRNLHMKANDDVHIKEIAADKSWWDSLFWNDIELSTRLQKRFTQIHIDDL